MPTPTQQKLFGVIGYPIAHSLSSHLHAFLYEKLGLDACYHAYSVAPSSLAAAIAGARALNFSGLNVTVPHKQTVLSFADSLDESAAKVGAANTLIFSLRGTRAANTDAAGFVQNLRQYGIDLRDRQVLLLGAGGAARAVAWAAIQAGSKRIFIDNRTPERARELAVSFGLQLAQRDTILSLPAGSIIVNATSVGMAPDADATPLRPAHFRNDLIYADVVYNPLQTRFLRQAEACGAQTVDGLGMLIWQAVRALELWLKQPIDIDPWYEALRSHLLEKLRAASERGQREAVRGA